MDHVPLASNQHLFNDHNECSFTIFLNLNRANWECNQTIKWILFGSGYFFFLLIRSVADCLKFLLQCRELIYGRVHKIEMEICVAPTIRHFLKDALYAIQNCIFIPNQLWMISRKSLKFDLVSMRLIIFTTQFDIFSAAAAAVVEVK